MNDEGDTMKSQNESIFKNEFLFLVELLKNIKIYRNDYKFIMDDKIHPTKLQEIGEYIFICVRDHRLQIYMSQKNKEVVCECVMPKAYSKQFEKYMKKLHRYKYVYEENFENDVFLTYQFTSYAIDKDRLFDIEDQLIEMHKTLTDIIQK